MTEKDAWDEGGYTLPGYRKEWEKINQSPWDPELVVWVVQFGRVFSRTDLCKHCWQFVGCTARNCCVDTLFDEGDGYASAGEIINFCCRRMCRHDREFHEKYCTVKLAGVGKVYVLRDEIRVVEKDIHGYVFKKLTDWL